MRLSNRLIFLLAISTVTLSGCYQYSEAYKRSGAGLPEPMPAEMASADYGSPVIDQDQIFKEWVLPRLKDPDSAKFEKTKPAQKAHKWLWNDKKKESESVFGYEFCGAVNAKNSYGGYTGTNYYYLFVRDNKILHYSDFKGLNFCEAKAAKEKK
ncbi:MAG: hypothetical protein LBE75_08635 [Burkholderiales bacterium]|jgi:hypothetical protein|nr:hypothetical protein [Burkholderiales bacterium]